MKNVNVTVAFGATDTGSGTGSTPQIVLPVGPAGPRVYPSVVCHVVVVVS
jgi:hypothetical protein